MLFLPVKPSWLLSRGAQLIYLVCSLLTLALLGTLIAVQLAITAAGFAALTPGARSVVKFLLFPEIMGTALLWVAMWYFWLGFDRSHYLKKALWFALMFFLAPFGTLLYYFLTYRRSTMLSGTSDSREKNRQEHDAIESGGDKKGLTLTP